MAKIATYAIDATPTVDDKVIGTDVDNELITKNYKIGDIIAMVPGGSLSVQSLNTLTGAVKLAAGTNIGLALDASKNEIVISSTGGGSITSVDGATGPAIDLAGKGGITVTTVGNLINIDGSGISSGVTSIDGATGPTVDIAGKGGITVTTVGDLINIDGTGIGGSPGTPVNGIQVNVASAFGAYDWLTANPTSNTLDLGNGSIGKGGTTAGIVNLFNASGDANALGSVRWYDFASSNNYVGIVGPGSMEKSVSYDIALPQNEPLANQILAVKNGATSTPWELVWTTNSSSSEDVKFKIDATDTQAGYWSDKIIPGGGITKTILTDGSGVKTVQLNQSLPTIVNSIKVGNSTRIGTFEFAGSGVSMTSGGAGQPDNIITFAGGGGSPAGVAGSVQFNDGTAFSAYTGFTFDKATAMLTLGQSAAPTNLGGILRVEGNGSTYGGKVELETGSSKGAPEIISLCGPTIGVKQEIHLPQTVATAVTQVLGIKSITGTLVQTEWKASSSGGTINFIGEASTNTSQAISNDSLTLVTLGPNTVWKNSDPVFGSVALSAFGAIDGCEIEFSGAGSAGTYWFVINANFQSADGFQPTMYAEVEGSPSSQKLVEMTTELLPINGNLVKKNYYKTFRYIKTGNDKQTVHLQVYFAAKDAGRGETIFTPSPVSGIAASPAASVQVWKN